MFITAGDAFPYHWYLVYTVLLHIARPFWTLFNRKYTKCAKVRILIMPERPTISFQV